MPKRKDDNRVISVRPETLYKAKIRAAQKGKTIKAYIDELIEKDAQEKQTPQGTTTAPVDEK